MSRKILIIEDDSILQRNIKAALELEDFSIVQLFTGEKAQETIEKENPDLILLDLMLPEKDGYNVLKDIKDDKNLKHIPVIVLSVIKTESSIAECKMLGVDDYLAKSSFTLEEIIIKIKKHLK